MNTLLVFAWIYAAMIANSFWEAYVEGKHAWDEGKLGWKIRIGDHVYMTAYHFWLFCVMHPLLLTLPLVVAGFSWRLFGILISAFASGVIIEDFFWFVVNPVFELKHWRPKFVKWYPWLKIGKFAVPAFYLVGIAVALLSWFFLWR